MDLKKKLSDILKGVQAVGHKDDIWSDLESSITLPNEATDTPLIKTITFPNRTPTKAVVVLSIGLLKNGYAGDVYADGDQYLAINEVGESSPVNAIKISDETLNLVEDSERGLVIIGNIDVHAGIAPSTEYELIWVDAVMSSSPVYCFDLQWGILYEY